MKHLIALAFVGLSLLGGQAAAQDAAIHDEIRAMRDGAIAAFEARDAETFASFLADDVKFTAMNNEAVHGKQAALNYYDRMMDAADGLITDVQVSFDTDELSTLYGDNTVAVALGGSASSFEMRAGLSFDMPLRWTAVLTRQSGDWQIAAMHFSANIFDNPLDTGLRKYLWVIVGLAALVGLGLGLIAGRRRAA